MDPIILPQQPPIRPIDNGTPKSTILNNLSSSPAMVDPMAITPSVASRTATPLSTSTPLSYYYMSDDEEDDDEDDDALMGEHIIATWKEEKMSPQQDQMYRNGEDEGSPDVATPPSSRSPDLPDNKRDTRLSPPPLLPISHDDDENNEMDESPASSYFYGNHSTRGDRLQLPPLPVAAAQQHDPNVQPHFRQATRRSNSPTSRTSHPIPSTFLTATTMMPSPTTLRLLQPRTVSLDMTDREGDEGSFGNGDFLFGGVGVGGSSPSAASSPRTLPTQPLHASPLPPTSPFSSSPSRRSPLMHHQHPRRSQQPQPTRTILQPILPRQNENDDRVSSQFFVPISDDSFSSL